MRVQSVCFVVALSAVSAASAGELDANLASVMGQTSGKDRVPALVYMTLQADVASLESQLLEDRTPRRDRHTVIMTALQAASELGQAPVLDWLDAQPPTTVDDVRTFWITSVIALEATPGTLRALAAREDVALVAPDYPIELIAPTAIEDDAASANRGGPEQGLVAIGAPTVWAMGYDGTGTVVSNIDTGVDGSHPALASRWRGLNPLYSGHPEWAFYDPYLGNHSFPYDGGSHGTHTMGTITGGAPGDQIGVAPGAEWIAAAPIDRYTIPQTVSDAILSFQWIADPDGDALTSFDVPHTCSNSWGLVTSHGYPECDQTFWSFIDNAEAAGVIVLFSAGNEGSSGLRRPGDRAYDDYRTMAVAAVDPYNGNSIAGFSSRGPTNCTPSGASAIKPEIAAPGVSTRSSVPGGGYSSYDGTSMASPHVNGVLALMLQANPDLTGEQAKQIVYDTAVDAGSPGKDNDYGYGVIDAVAAVESALETVSLTVSYPEGRPDLIDPAGGTEVLVRFGGNVAPEPGTALLNWADDGGGSGAEPMSPVGADHIGVFPGFECGAAVSYWISVESVEGDYVTSPYNAPSDAWTADAWTGMEVAFDDDFNADQGWTVYAGAGTGNWQRATPVGNGGGRCDNATDQDGSGMCYVSGNSVDEDIDDGSTILTSPAMDASGGGTLRYARWYSNGIMCGGADPNNDIFVVEVSDDNGGSWIELEVVGPGGSEADGGWFVKEWAVEDLPVSMTDTFRIRFTASDLNDPSVVEAAVDGVTITRMYCDDATMPGDADGDGDVDTDDILALIGQWGACPAGCGADFDGDGDVDTDDMLTLLANFGA